jgi:hypothetical protein
MVQTGHSQKFLVGCETHRRGQIGPSNHHRKPGPANLLKVFERGRRVPRHIPVNVGVDAACALPLRTSNPLLPSASRYRGGQPAPTLKEGSRLSTRSLSANVSVRPFESSGSASVEGGQRGGCGSASRALSAASVLEGLPRILRVIRAPSLPACSISRYHQAQSRHPRRL